jgi:arylsulfatase A-like enzyme
LNRYDGGDLAAYGRMVREMDSQVGRFLKAMENTRAAGNTIVVFTSDNGGERFSGTRSSAVRSFRQRVRASAATRNGLRGMAR